MINFESINELIIFANKNNKLISDITISQTAFDLELDEKVVFEMMKDNYAIMKESITNGLDENLKSASGLSGQMAKKMKKHVDDNKCFSGNFFGEILFQALATSELNAGMGRIVAAPTAGSCGVIPSCMVALQNKYTFSDDEITKVLFTASAFGIVIAKNASISGAEGGCQAECGTAAAMAAAAICELLGGTCEMSAHAAAQALKSLMGLVCDPVAGLVEEPCIIRNASSAAVAVASAEMSLAGIESIIPVDEVIQAMKNVGNEMSSCLKETSLGGIAVSKTGLEIKNKL